MGKSLIGLVVPALEEGGGVPAVAEFLFEAIGRSARFKGIVVSLATDAVGDLGVSISRPSSWMRGVQTERGVWHGIPFVRVGAFASEFEFQRYRPRRALARLLQECDLIQVVSGSPAWANAVLGIEKPVALHVATRARVERRARHEKTTGLGEVWRRAMTGVTDRLDDGALRKVDALQLMNPWMFEYAKIVNVGREVDVRYAPPGVDAGVFRPALHRELSQAPYILCVGRLNDPRKNVGLLLEAYAQLATPLRCAVRLVLAGASEPQPAFWQRATALGLDDRISYFARPSAEELVRLYQQASIFALPSDEEGFGMVVLEAMACGVPVVSTRSGGPDGIISNGEDGFLVPLADSQAMAAQLSAVLRDPALNRTMGVKARQTIERRYDTSVASEVFVDMWDRMAQKLKAA